ncbi:putative odorant receptor 85d [Pectinophora gossypiella]|uniref:putative odorant receptor 85d n=1 Tax=Pectinophora gossypiella TaxID=13191 RepID=UPI00214ECC9C|nr:putative odorant receptor 85d [Pectinophora gossypiella]
MFIACSFAVVFICLTAFTCTVVDGLYETLRYFFFFLSIVLDTCIQCMMGQVLLNHSLKFSERIYNCDWVYADVPTRKMIAMFLMRSQAPFKLSGNGYFIMNLNTYSSICSTSYQFFNLLRTIYTTQPKT